MPQKLIKFVPLGPAKHGDSETANESKRDKRNLDTLQRGINCSEDNLLRLNDISNSFGCGNAKRMRIRENDYTLVEDAQ